MVLISALLTCMGTADDSGSNLVGQQSNTGADYGSNYTPNVQPYQVPKPAIETAFIPSEPVVDAYVLVLEGEDGGAIGEVRAVVGDQLVVRLAESVVTVDISNVQVCPPPSAQPALEPGGAMEAKGPTGSTQLLAGGSRSDGLVH